MRLSLSVSLTQLNQQAGGAVSAWIMATGFFNDDGIWVDSDIWRD